jgi:hypothetical protein
MREGKVVGDKITFEVALERGSILFDLTVSGDEIKGDMNLNLTLRECTVVDPHLVDEAREPRSCLVCR